MAAEYTRHGTFEITCKRLSITYQIPYIWSGFILTSNGTAQMLVYDDTGNRDERRMRKLDEAGVRNLVGWGEWVTPIRENRPVIANRLRKVH